MFIALGEKNKAKQFLLLCQETWKEYAPGLLSQTNKCMEKLDEVKMQYSPSEIREMVEEFIEDANSEDIKETVN